MRIEIPVLIETCMEAGPMTIDQIDDALSNTKDWKELKAVMSLVEYYIGAAHSEATVRGQDPTIRSEAAGAAHYLKLLRSDLIDKTKETEPEEIQQDPSGP